MDGHPGDRHSVALHVSTGGHEAGGVHVLAHVEVDETPRHRLLPVPAALLVAWSSPGGGRWSGWWLGHLAVAVLAAGPHKVRAAYAGATVAAVVATRDVKP
eukprot:scaffold1871_cov62-Phaeocystis_antarctica.AAC.2